MKKGKKYLAALEKVEANKRYTLEEGIAKVKEIAFDLIKLYAQRKAQTGFLTLVGLRS